MVWAALAAVALFWGIFFAARHDWAQAPVEGTVTGLHYEPEHGRPAHKTPECFRVWVRTSKGTEETGCAPEPEYRRLQVGSWYRLLH